MRFPLPENVHVFPKDRVTDFLHQVDGTPLARIVGTSRGARTLHFAEFSPDAVGLFTIGVASRVVASDLLARSRLVAAHPTHVDAGNAGDVIVRPATYPALRKIHYWALGGQGPIAARCSVRRASPIILARRRAAAQPNRAYMAARW